MLELSIALAVVIGSGPVQAHSASATDRPTFVALISAGNDALQAGRLQEALAAAMEASRSAPDRYEAFALAALVMRANGASKEAHSFVVEAIRRAPADQLPKLEALAVQIRMSKPAPTPAEVNVKRNALRMIATEVDAARTPQRRAELIQEFMARSDEYIEWVDSDVAIWVMRAAIAMELGDSEKAWQAGDALRRLDQLSNTTPEIAAVIANLERKGWLGPISPDTAARNKKILDDRIALEQATSFARGISGRWSGVAERTDGAVRSKTSYAMTISPECNGTIDARASQAERTFAGWRESDVQQQQFKFSCNGTGQLSGDVGGRFDAGSGSYLYWFRPDNVQVRFERAKEK